MIISAAFKKYLAGLAFLCAIGLGTDTASAVTFNYGDFNPGNAATSPPGTSYDFTGLPFSFSTNPLAFQWGYVIDGNPTPQSAASIKTFVEGWTGLTLTPVVQQANVSGSGFSTSIVAEIVAIHLGGGELVFIFNTATLFTLSNLAASGGLGLSNYRTYNYTDNDNNQGPPQVPLPAGILLLISALGGLGFLARYWKAGAEA